MHASLESSITSARRCLEVLVVKAVLSFFVEFVRKVVAFATLSAGGLEGGRHPRPGFLLIGRRCAALAAGPVVSHESNVVFVIVVPSCCAVLVAGYY